MRTKKSIFNLLADILPQVIISILGFIRIRVFLSAIGTEQLGVYQLFGQILCYLALAELGLTSAVMYYLYKPIHEKNYKKISQIIVGAKKSFTVIMLVMFICGVVLAPNVKFFIADTTLSNTFIIIAFIMTILVNILSYFSTPYVLLFDSNQEKYKYIVWSQLIVGIRYIVEMLAIWLTKSLYVALAIEILFTLIQNFVIKYLFEKNYDYVDMKADKDLSFWSKTKDLIPHKIGTLIAYNIDVIILSKFLGLTNVVIYNCYYYITNTISNLIGKMSSATLAGVGNLIVAEPKKVYKVFLEYNSMLFFLATVICIPLGIVISPFVSLWYGSDMIVSNFTVFLFAFILFYGIIRIVLNTFCTAAGIFRPTLICTYLEIVINLVVSLLLIKKYEITGLLFGTALSLIFSEFVIKPFILNKHLFNDKIYKYYLDCFKYIVIAMINMVLLSLLSNCFDYNNLLLWFIFGCIIFIINLLITSVMFKLINKFEFINRLNIFKKERKHA